MVLTHTYVGKCANTFCVTPAAPRQSGQLSIGVAEGGRVVCVMGGSKSGEGAAVSGALDHQSVVVHGFVVHWMIHSMTVSSVF